MRAAVLTLAVLTVLAAGLVAGTASGKVVNENIDNLPPGCNEISEEIELNVTGGRGPAEGIPGVVYTFDQHSWEVPTCARITITFHNEDAVRHQFMPHDVWPNGFMLIEVDGPGSDTGTFITPAQPSTIMVHCGVAQHQQKGMKSQFLVGGGIGDLPNIPTVSGLPPEGFVEGQTTEDGQQAPGPSAGLIALALGLTAAVGLRTRR